MNPLDLDLSHLTVKSAYTAQADKSLTVCSNAALRCVDGAMCPSLSDTWTSFLPAKPFPHSKWSSHFQGERLHGITHFVLRITFSLPVWLSPMDMAGWLYEETDGGRWLAWHMLRGCDESVTRGGRDEGDTTLSVWCVDERLRSDLNLLHRDSKLETHYTVNVIWIGSLWVI